MIDRSHLQAAAEAGIITDDQAARLYDFLAQQPGAAASGPRFTFTNVLYYLGGMLAIGAMSLFMTLGWESFGGWGVFFIALLYAGVAFKLAGWFERNGHDIPAGIMAAFVVVLVPLATWALQHALGYWADGGGIRGYRDYHYLIDWRWLTLELATLLAGALMLWRWRTPFLVMPIAVTLWYMSMDLGVMLANAETWSESAWVFRQWFSLSFGLVMVLVAFFVDLRARFSKDYAFWLYLFGLLAFWGALSSMGSNLLSGKLIYLAINVGLVLVGAVLVRRVFTVFGALGVAMVLGDLSWHYFRDSWAFPIALTLIGIGVIFLGVWWNRHQAHVGVRLRARLPADLRALIEARAAA